MRVKINKALFWGLSIGVPLFLIFILAAVFVRYFQYVR
jgi:hypothetical protein